MIRHIDSFIMIATDYINPADDGANPRATRLIVTGRVQGVGFRPFTARLAIDLGLAGWVRNTPRGVEIQLEGDRERIDRFRERLIAEAPEAARIDTLIEEAAKSESATSFLVAESEARGVRDTETAPDRAVCHECVAEFDDPTDRRYGYALSSCVVCGPRFTVQTEAPYDRARTTMREFPPCPSCSHEYHSIVDRRFHAETLCCPVCGPVLSLYDPKIDQYPHDIRDIGDRGALARAGERIRAGGIVAVKGIGGFHLICNATSTAAVEALRERKRRGRKPFAVLFADRESLEQRLEVDDAEWDLLASPAAPIVPLRRRAGCDLAEAIAPELASVGAILAYSLIHHGLLEAAGVPLVATSGNASNEPMPIENDAAVAELKTIADLFILHNRRIVRHADDGVSRAIAGRPVPIRIGRGSAPVELRMPFGTPAIMGAGGHMKAAVAFARGGSIVLGQHIGDLDTLAIRRRYRSTADDLRELIGGRPEWIAHDLHPDYESTRYAEESGLKRIPIQHHHAHIASCMAEHGETGPILGIAFDGTGLGDDGAIWGGEFLVVDRSGYRRIGSILPFRLAGGDRAAREPRTCAAGVCRAAGITIPHELGFSDKEAILLGSIFRSPRAAAVCTSAGRLFDAWAALVGMRERADYEGEAAIRFEEIADPAERLVWPIEITGDDHGMLLIDWRPWVVATLSSIRRGIAPGIVAAAFHRSLAEACVAIARRTGIAKIALSGGCFQNKLLSEILIECLTKENFHVLTHCAIPPGDGGLAVGQVWAAALYLSERG